MANTLSDIDISNFKDAEDKWRSLDQLYINQTGSIRNETAVFEFVKIENAVRGRLEDPSNNTAVNALGDGIKEKGGPIRKAQDLIYEKLQDKLDNVDSDGVALKDVPWVKAFLEQYQAKVAQERTQEVVSGRAANFKDELKDKICFSADGKEVRIGPADPPNFIALAGLEDDGKNLFDKINEEPDATRKKAMLETMNTLLMGTACDQEWQKKFVGSYRNEVTKSSQQALLSVSNFSDLKGKLHFTRDGNHLYFGATPPKGFDKKTSFLDIDGMDIHNVDDGYQLYFHLNAEQRKTLLNCIGSNPSQEWQKEFVNAKAIDLDEIQNLKIYYDPAKPENFQFGDHPTKPQNFKQLNLTGLGSDAEAARKLHIILDAMGYRDRLCDVIEGIDERKRQPWHNHFLQYHKDYQKSVSVDEKHIKDQFKDGFSNSAEVIRDLRSSSDHCSTNLLTSTKTASIVAYKLDGGKKTATTGNDADFYRVKGKGFDYNVEKGKVSSNIRENTPLGAKLIAESLLKQFDDTTDPADRKVYVAATTEKDCKMMIKAFKDAGLNFDQIQFAYEGDVQSKSEAYQTFMKAKYDTFNIPESERENYSSTAPVTVATTAIRRDPMMSFFDQRSSLAQQLESEGLKTVSQSA
ncbi:hypothetical protein L3V82_01295 [Thiotrichales bacterium 19S3-7]|nr:hypothetical protein [Thiotrichales bacterium 19S3-7]MCF6800797.1 hypothetical protein [Thiotrichales bacterium 19S3-11]